MKATAQIQHNEGIENITGDVVAETTSHLLIYRPSNKLQSEVREWFARSSRRVNCIVYET
jgi:hypothetical protein